MISASSLRGVGELRRRPIFSLPPGQGICSIEPDQDGARGHLHVSRKGRTPWPVVDNFRRAVLFWPLATVNFLFRTALPPNEGCCPSRSCAPLAAMSPLMGFIPDDLSPARRSRRAGLFSSHTASRSSRPLAAHRLPQTRVVSVFEIASTGTSWNRAHPAPMIASTRWRNLQRIPFTFRCAQARW